MIGKLKNAVNIYFKYTVPVVAALSFGGIVISLAVGGILTYSGVAGCVISSFILGIVAFLREKKDIVAIMAPLYAVLIFNPYSEFTTGIIMQIMYAVTISVIAVRLIKKY
jgi:fructose-specific phosphotransferase system IIC component